MKHLTQREELDALVQRTAKAMQTRLYEKHRQGRRGWKRNINGLLERFDRACRQRDFLDACNLAAMLHDFQQRNTQREPET